jgi:hypothetical protein
MSTIAIDEIISDDERVLSPRKAVAQDERFAELLEKATPEERAAGRLIGRLMANGSSIKKIDESFAWWEKEFNNGKGLRNIEKALALYQALMHSDISDAGVKILKKFYASVNQ